MKIYLIGFMGCGKSTLGKPLAREFGYRFIDLDGYIEEQEARSIPDIFATDGERAFRTLENYYLCQLEQLDDVVISTGGGTPCFNDNMSLMKRSGQTVYLKQEPRTLASRLINARVKRPLIEGKSYDELLSYIERSLAERDRYYIQASVIIANPDRDASRLLNILRGCDSLGDKPTEAIDLG